MARSAVCLVYCGGLALAAGLAPRAEAATYTWDAEGGADTNMSNTANWFDGVGDPADTTFLTAGTHDLVFGSAGSLAQQTGNYSVNGITFNRAFQISKNDSGNTITINGGGVTLNSTVDGEVLVRCDLKLNVNTFIANNSTQNFRTTRGFIADAARSITNNGSGSGWVRLTGGNFLNANVTLVQDSLTSAISLESASIGAPIAGKVVIRKGLFSWNYQGNPTAGNIVLGSTTASATDWAKLGFNAYGSAIGLGSASVVVTNSNPIVLAGTVGTNTIASGTNTQYSGGNGYHTMCYTGGVTGANSLYLENIPDSKGNDNLRFQTGSINMTNKLVHIGAGGGTCTVDSVIGPNVTEVIQNSGTSPLVLGGSNTYTGNTTVLAGTLRVTDSAALPSGTSVFIAAGGAKLELNVNAMVTTLWLDGVQQGSGTYGSESSTADNKSNTYFAGTGVLTVTSSPGPKGTVISVW